MTINWEEEYFRDDFFEHNNSDMYNNCQQVLNFLAM